MWNSVTLVQSRSNIVQPATRGSLLPLHHNAPGFQSPLFLSVPKYPLQVYSEDGRQYRIDERLYYGSGLIGQAVDLACYKFQAHIFREMAMPEAIELVDEFFHSELTYIYNCVIDAFDELGLISFEYKCFRLTHERGMALIVSKIYIFNIIFIFSGL